MVVSGCDHDDDLSRRFCMSGDFTDIERRVGVVDETVILLASFVVVALLTPFGSRVHAQPFDDVIRRALFDPGTGGCDSRIAPTRNLLARICGLTGNQAGPSGGSTSSLAREVAPIEEPKVARKIGPINPYISAEYERFDKDVTTFEPGTRRIPDGV
jgi:hypothetical protein